MSNSIKTIQNISNFGAFHNMSQKDCEFSDCDDCCNIIFGYNGSGKTTLSNVFSLFANKSFVSQETKDEILSAYGKPNNDPCIKLQLSDKNTLVWSDDVKKEKDIYVFNANFIIEHIFDGTNAKIKKFSGVTTKELKILDEKINDLLIKKNTLEDKQKIMEDKFEKIKNKYSLQFNNDDTLSGSRMPKIKITDEIHSDYLTKKIDEIKDEIIILRKDYKLVKQQGNILNELQLLDDIKLNLININFVQLKAKLKQSISNTKYKLIIDNCKKGIIL